MKILFLFPISYPFHSAAENTFLQNEIPFLSKHFDKIIILPEEARGEKEEINSPNVTLDITFAKYLGGKKNNVFFKILHLFKTSFWKEIFFSQQPSSLKRIKKTLTFLEKESSIKKWFYNYLKQNDLLTCKILIYTYWTTATTFSMSKLKKIFNNIKVISRAHGIDLYEERGFVCCRRETLKDIDELHTVSIAGQKYLAEKYPMSKEKVNLSPLGVLKAKQINRIVDLKRFVIVSCSQIINIKRVHLIAQALAILGGNKNLKVESIIWYHFGDGELKEELNNYVSIYNSHFIYANIEGFVPNDKLLEFYAFNQVNLFITTSSTEGGRPVSIQEALTFGIPILATNVGGIPELVDESVGRLLPINPTPEEIANEILFFINNPKIVENMRLNAIKKWENDLNAEINFDLFAKKISDLI